MIKKTQINEIRKDSDMTDSVKVQRIVRKYLEDGYIP